ncbi:MAG: M64 family metallo-endopeptidase [Actinomycetota bacterium]|nr:M64 family metallo-endopeptidase [Actinomycetota bacterium]
MGTSNGTVQGVTKIVDHGPASQRYNIVLLSEGYTAAEMAQWSSDAQDFADYLFSQVPFSDLDLQCAINVYRVDVTSDESGADDPNCGDGDGDGSTADTYFDASFCGDGNIRRLLISDSGIAIAVLNAQVPEWDTGLVVVNHSDRGGAGGQVPTTSTGGDWLEVALHELGHSAFGLGDEYEYWAGCTSGETDRNNHPNTEPSEPNVTVDSNRATIKWGTRIAAATAMPTTNNADCSQCDPQANPVPAGTVGAFEGAHYFHCDAFRPEFDCRMRNTGVPFCAVCGQVVRDTLAPFAQPTTLTLVSPTVAFTDVEQGTTTARPVAIAVDSCADLTFTITDGPRRTDGGPANAGGDPILDTPLGLVTVSAGPPDARTAYVWITYKATNPGSSLTGTVTVECDETGDSWTVPITANTIARVTVGVMLSLDKSGSMLGAASGAASKADALRDAAEVFVDVIPGHDGVGVNSFATDAYPGVPITAAGGGVFGAGRIAARNEVRNYAPDPAGMTAIGDAVELSDQALSATVGFDERAMIVFTDGHETEPKYIADVTGLIASNPRIFAIGLGTAANLQPATLAALCSGNDGYLLLTGSGGGDTFFRLAKYYLQILAGLTNAEIVLDPEGFISPGAGVVQIPFTLAETDTGADVVLVTPVPSAVKFGLRTPDGDVIVPSAPVPGAEYMEGARNAYYRVSLPTLVNGRQAREGTWHALLLADRKRWDERDDRRYDYVAGHSAAVANGLPYSLVVHARSNLKLVARCHQGSYVPGATLQVRGVLTEYGIPVDGRASLRAEMTRPDGTQATLVMPEVEPGAFETTTVAHQAGVYHFRVLAAGQTLRGRAFTREQLVTGFTYRGGDDPTTPGDGGDGGGGRDDWCRLLECLLGSLTPDAYERMKGLGVDLDHLLRCLRKLCSRRSALSAEEVDVVRQVAVRLGVTTG